MSDALSFAELDEQHVELLPGRTVLSMLSLSGGGDGVGSPVGNINIGGFQFNIADLGIGGSGGSANGGAGGGGG